MTENITEGVQSITEWKIKKKCVNLFLDMENYIT